MAVIPQERIPEDKQRRAANGGDAYELENASRRRQAGDSRFFKTVRKQTNTQNKEISR